ncbi:MAG: response regulator [Nitrospirae bacterium]|nr:response regulator [Nitrospirota bacterium]
MKIDRKSLLYRLLIPVFLILLAISTALIISINTIANHIIEEFVQHAIDSHVSETMRIIELAQADLTTARLLDIPPVVEAKKKLVLEAISLNWQRRDVSGAISDESDSIILSTLPSSIIKDVPFSRASGHLYLDFGKGELYGEIVNYPAWKWKIFVGTKTLAHNKVRREVYYLIPTIVLGLLLMLTAFIIILRRNLQRPVQSLVSALGTVQDLPRTGISELDRIGTAMNETMGKLKVRTDELASELEERKKAEEALRAEKNKSEAIIAAMGDGVSIQDLNFQILYQNDVHKSFVGSHIGEYCYRAYESSDAVCEGCPVALTFIDGMVHRVQRVVQLPGGTRYFEVTTSPLRDASGAIVAGIEVVRDVTLQRHNEDQLRQAQKMEGIGQLAGGIAHDFNNILTAIIGYASLLELKLKGDEQLKPFVSYILESSERASGLTKSLLAFSRKQPVEMKPLNLNELACGFRNIMSRLIGEDIEFELKCSVEDLVVEADKGQLEQVLMNLATNARDAMPDGGKISISTEQVVIDGEMGELPKGSYAVVVFSDNGSGIEQKVQEHIFEPFFTTKETGKGTGLGLAVVYGIIKNHGGAIHLYSEPGQGTTFRIYLPVSETAAAKNGGLPAEAVPHGTETILLVEDNADTRRVTKMLLEEFGYTVLEAVDGEDAIAVFRDKQDRIDLILSDLIMPKKNGKDACQEMAKIRPGVKTILMSGYTADILTQKGSLDPGMHFISKPLSPSTLLNKVREVLTF